MQLSSSWTDSYSGQQRASISYEATMGEESGWVRLRDTTTSHWTGEKTDHDYQIALTTTPQPFGGRRWWWVCPRRGDLVSKLYMPNGGSLFASRKAHRLAYRSQRQSPHDRAISQAFKRRRQLGSTAGIGDYIEKPKGMRWATFDRKMDKIEAAEAVCNAHLAQFVQQFTKRKR
jgi:hypothetical protein